MEFSKEVRDSRYEDAAVLNVDGLWVILNLAKVGDGSRLKIWSTVAKVITWRFRGCTIRISGIIRLKYYLCLVH